MQGKIAGYYRLSMEDDNVKEESGSITNQRILVKRYILERKELSDCEYCEFYDDGYSGTTMKRPGMQALLERIKQDEVRCVIVKDLSRFSRDYIELGTYIERIFPFMGIRFISISDHYDSYDHMGKTAGLDVGFKSLLADFYCKDVSERVKSSLAAKRKQGIYATGNTPFGYCKSKDDPNELQILAKEASIVRCIFGLSLSGLNLREICRTLNDEKILTPLEFKNQRKKQNREEPEQKELEREEPEQKEPERKQLEQKELERKKFWQPGTVRSILLNESYIGAMVYNKTSQKEVGGSHVILKPRKEWLVLKNHHEAIVDKAIFEKVQESYPLKNAGNRLPLEYALKGKVFCSYCGGALKVMKLAGGKLFYYCGNQSLSSDNGCMVGKMGNDLVEHAVLAQIEEQIKQLADSDEIRKSVSMQWQEQFQRKKREISGTEREIGGLTERKVKLLEKYHAGGLSREKYMESHGQLEHRVSQKRVEKEELNKQSEHYKGLIGKNESGHDDFLQQVGFDVLTAEMVAAFVDKIEIDQNKTVHIYWKFNEQGINDVMTKK